MIKKLFIILLLILSVSVSQGQQGFKESQLEYPRVKEAFREKEEGLEKKLSTLNMEAGSIEIYLLAFKQEKQLEVWARNRGAAQFVLFTTYDICQSSGKLGPKRKQGDLQVPEGFYHISAWNPWSNFHLSMCINYPNRSDRILGVQQNLGGNICVHGSCVTIGCIPLTDEVIKELYILFVEAKNNGQTNVPVSIYPARLSNINYNRLVKAYENDEDRLNLWSDLKTAYDLFISLHQLPEVTFLSDGRHSLR
jgi:murein L,D-transpeptidase YafK